MKNRLQTSMIAIVATIAAAALAAAPATAKDSKKPASHKSAAAAAASMGHVPAVQEAPKRGQHDEKPGPAWRTVGGTVKDIDNNAYTVEDFEGNQVKLYVGYLRRKLAARLGLRKTYHCCSLQAAAREQDT